MTQDDDHNNNHRGTDEFKDDYLYSEDEFTDRSGKERQPVVSQLTSAERHEGNRHLQHADNEDEDDGRIMAYLEKIETARYKFEKEQ